VPSVAECTALAAAEITRLGAGAVSTEPGLVAKVSSDWSRMSPVLQEKIPPGHYLADVVVRPTEPEQVPVILKVAFDHDVPVTPRGAGTGNYGQATPFDGGILLDLRDLRSITVNDGGTITADAGAPLTEIDKVARAAGRDIWIFPSTKGSTVGGFVGGGSAGTGTIEHGTTSDGFVVAVTVAPMDGGGHLITYRGDALHPHLRRHRDPRRRRDPDGPGAGLERALRGLRHLRRARRRPPHPPRPAGTPPPGLR
jgi:FAD/FMN-containing dehydrogenase